MCYRCCLGVHNNVCKRMTVYVSDGYTMLSIYRHYVNRIVSLFLKVEKQLDWLF